MNWKFVFRGTLVALVALSALVFVAYRSLPRLLPEIPYGPTPLPPAITAFRGNLPVGWPGMEAYATYEGSEPVPAGSAFIFRLPSGGTAAAAAAHSFDLARGLQSVRLSLDESSIQLEVLHGMPGEPRTFSMNLTNDYVLFAVKEEDAPVVILEPDERGIPQPGERIVLYPGFGAENGKRWGTILESDRNGAWAVMDEAFEPGMMSGSPIVSYHTGRVVGMAVAAGLREGHTVIGMHPIGSLVEKGLEAVDDIPLSEYETP
ncbi:MAG: hypothetical protein BMS9Abin28_1708 [Anaerolineae bacterium]|nr:MAG: hypothetical protein BMS9Abin28_1708 [Anaerolineae bacterium]